jgi:hypothetical protein
MSFTIDPLTAYSKYKKVASSKKFFGLNFWRDEYYTMIVTHIIGSIGPTTPSSQKPWRFLLHSEIWPLSFQLYLKNATSMHNAQLSNTHREHWPTTPSSQKPWRFLLHSKIWPLSFQLYLKNKTSMHHAQLSNTHLGNRLNTLCKEVVRFKFLSLRN